jgi:hypothetical protein
MSDDTFAQDLAELQRTADESRARQPEDAPVRLVGASLARFLEGCLPAGVEVPEKLLEHPCGRCGRAESERVTKARVGDESTCLVYWTARCRTCTDVEWTLSWKARNKKAMSDNDRELLRELDEELAAWKDRGRKFYG